MDKGKIILEELNEWIYNDENQAGDKLQIIDASDVPTIVENLVKKLTIPVVVGSDLKDLKPGCPECNGNDFSWSRCDNCGYDPFK